MRPPLLLRTLGVALFALVGMGCSSANRPPTETAAADATPTVTADGSTGSEPTTAPATPTPASTPTAGISPSPAATPLPSFQPPEVLDADAIVGAYERLRDRAPTLRLTRTTTTSALTSVERVTVDATLVNGEWIGRATFEGLEVIAGARAARNEALATVLLTEGVNFATIEGAVHVDRALAVTWDVGIETVGSEFVAVRLEDLTPGERFVLGLFAPTDLALEAAEGDPTTAALVTTHSNGSTYSGEIDGATIVVSLDPDGGLRSLLFEGPISLAGAQADLAIDARYAASGTAPATAARPDDEDVTQAFVDYVEIRSQTARDLPGN